MEKYVKTKKIGEGEIKITVVFSFDSATARVSLLFDGNYETGDNKKFLLSESKELKAFIDGKESTYTKTLVEREALSKVLQSDLEGNGFVKVNETVKAI